MFHVACFSTISREWNHTVSTRSELTALFLVATLTAAGHDAEMWGR